MKYFLFIITVTVSTLSAAENNNFELQLQKLQDSDYVTCREGFISAGTFAGITALISTKAIYRCPISHRDFMQLIFADSFFASRAKNRQDTCYEIQDEIRNLRRSAEIQAYVVKDPELERLAWINSGKHFLLGVAFGAALSTTMKAYLEPEKIRSEDIIIPAAFITLSLVAAKMADDHVKAGHLHFAKKIHNP